VGASTSTGGPSMPITATLRDALSVLISESTDALPVTDKDGSVIGTVGVEQINRALRRAASTGAAENGAGATSQDLAR
jgi:predicted transcriptional regulator